MSIPFAMFLERRVRRWPWVVGSLWVMRVGHVGFILIPFLPAYRPEAIVALLLLINIPLALFNTGWLPMFADVVPLARRARVMSARSMTLNVTVMVMTFVLGRWLDAAPFPFNYQLMFGMGVVTSFLSTVYVARMIVPDEPPVREARERPKLATIVRLVSERRPFVNITANTLVFNIAVWMGTPLQPIYFVRELHASDGWLGLWLGLISGGAILGNLIWPRLIDRRGYSWVLRRATLLSAL
jgi:hypothetical protein